MAEVDFVSLLLSCAYALGRPMPQTHAEAVASESWEERRAAEAEEWNLSFRGCALANAVVSQMGSGSGLSAAFSGGSWRYPQGVEQSKEVCHVG